MPEWVPGWFKRPGLFEHLFHARMLDEREACFKSRDPRAKNNQVADVASDMLRRLQRKAPDSPNQP